jgi:hypothetical protein
VYEYSVALAHAPGVELIVPPTCGVPVMLGKEIFVGAEVGLGEKAATCMGIAES